MHILKYGHSMLSFLHSGREKKEARWVNWWRGWGRQREEREGAIYIYKIM